MLILFLFVFMIHHFEDFYGIKGRSGDYFDFISLNELSSGGHRIIQKVSSKSCIYIIGEPSRLT